MQPIGNTGYGNDHHDYPATDIFNECGSTVVSPVDGVVVDLRRDDPWVASVDDPWLRGGRYIAILGNDGVRYYLAHFQHIDDSIEAGMPVSAGTPIAELGRSGRAGACHVHLGISPPCPNPEWWVRRGVIWPSTYLDDWKQGGGLSPAAELTAWSAEHLDECTTEPATG